MKTVIEKWRRFEKNTNVGPVLFLTIYQIALIGLLPYYLLNYTPASALWIACFTIFCINGLSITFGYHRLFSHRAFKTHPVIETITLFFASMTFQGTALRWSYEHRIHHAHVDTDEDPYSINKGFLYAHCLWLKNKPKEIQKTLVSDLMLNPRVMFQHRFGKLCMVASNLLVIFIMWWITGDFLGSLLIPFGLRLFLNHHTTWFINSLAHTWGSRHFCNELSAVDNFIISLLTFGEGYHNYHHTYAADYRNGIRWYHFDPTKWIIWSLNKLHLASNLRRIDHHLVKKRIIQERTELLMSQIGNKWEKTAGELSSLADRIGEQLTQLANLKKNLEGSKELQERAKALQKSVKQQIREWKLAFRFLQKAKRLA